MIAILSPSLPPPLLSTCLCARLLLIFEALSFVFVRCPKDYAMKRDRWRGAGWLWLWCVTACTHTHAHCNCWILQTVLTSDPSLSCLSVFPLPTTTSLETLVESRGATWNLIETALNWRSVKGINRPTINARFKIDEPLSCPRVCVCVCLGW